MSDETRRSTTNRRGRIRIEGFDGGSAREREQVAGQAGTTQGVESRRRKAWRRFKHNRTAVAGLVIIGAMVLMTVFAQRIEIAGVTVQPFSIVPHPPGESDFGALRQPPSPAHPFGTNWAGKDILSRVMVGGRYSLSIGGIAVLLALLVGVPLGAIAGYYGGWIDEVIMRVVDVLYSFPYLVLAIGILAVFGRGFWKMILALVLVSWIGYARLIRGEILSVKENEYVTAAKALGARDRTIIYRHIIPNAITPVIVQATLRIGSVVLFAAALGFLGLGLPPSTPEWGTMLSSSRRSLVQGQWWITVFPGLMIFLFVLSINLVGDGLRDALNPQETTSDEQGRVR